MQPFFQLGLLRRKRFIGLDFPKSIIYNAVTGNEGIKYPLRAPAESLRLVQEGGSGFGEYLPKPERRKLSVVARRCAVYSAAGNHARAEGAFCAERKWYRDRLSIAFLP